MFRSTITLTTLASLLIAAVAPPAHACKGRSYRTTYVRPRPVHVVRPARVMRPTVVVRPTVAPAQLPAEKELPTVPAGATMTIPANFLGTATGSAFLVFNNIKLPIEIKRWTMTGVTIALPPMAIKDAVIVRVDLVLPDGKLGHSQELRVTAPASIVLHPVRPSAPLPAQPALAAELAPTVSAPVQAAVGGSPRIQFSPQAVGTGTPGQPIVLPPAASATTTPAVDSRPAMPGQGTPSEPFILPTAPAIAPTATTAAKPAQQAAPGARPVEVEDWLDNNPILLEGQTKSDQDEQPTATVETEPAAAAATNLPSANDAASLGNMASIFATVAKTLLSN